MSAPEEFVVTIGLYRSHGIDALILETPKGGTRVTSMKASGHWTFIKDFRCTITLADLIEAAALPDAAQAGEGA